MAASRTIIIEIQGSSPTMETPCNYVARGEPKHTAAGLYLKPTDSDVNAVAQYAFQLDEHEGRIWLRYCERHGDMPVGYIGAFYEGYFPVAIERDALRSLLAETGMRTLQLTELSPLLHPHYQLRLAGATN